MKYCGSLIFFWMLCFLALVPASAQHVVTDHGSRIIFSQSDKDFFSIRNNIRDIENAVTRMLRLETHSKSSVGCTVFMVDDQPEGNIRLVQTRNTLLIYLPADHSLWKNDFEVQRKLVCCFYLIHSGIQVSDMKRLDIIPYWLQLGTLQFFQRVSAGDVPNQIKFYPRVRNAELGGAKIELDDVLLDKITPDRGALFELYLELCDMLVSRCYSDSSSRNNLFYEMIVLAANKDIPPDEAFYMTAEKIIPGSSKHKRRQLKQGNLSGKELVRKWFRNYLRSQIINNFMPLPMHIWEKRYNQLRTVEYLTLRDGGSSTTVSCQLNDLTGKWNEVYNKKNLKADLVERFSVFERESPALFTPAFAKLYSAVNALPEQQIDVVKPAAADGIEAKPTPDLLNIALDDIAQARKRQKEIEAYLELNEQQLFPLWRKYKYEFQIMDIADEKSRKTWLELNNYLDELEKNLKAE
jgi:hypothetical protein